MAHDRSAAAGIEQESPVGLVPVVGENVLRARLSDQLSHFGAFGLQLRMNAGDTARRTHADLHSDGPYASLSQDILLGHDEAVNSVLASTGPIHIHLGHAAMANPHARPVSQGLAGHP